CRSIRLGRIARKLSVCQVRIVLYCSCWLYQIDAFFPLAKAKSCAPDGRIQRGRQEKGFGAFLLNIRIKTRCNQITYLQVCFCAMEVSLGKRRRTFCVSVVVVCHASKEGL